MEVGCNIDMKDHKVNGIQVKVVNVSGFLDAHSFPDLEKVLDGVSFISNTKYKKIGDRYEFYQ